MAKSYIIANRLRGGRAAAVSGIASTFAKMDSGLALEGIRSFERALARVRVDPAAKESLGDLREVLVIARVCSFDNRNVSEHLGQRKTR